MTINKKLRILKDKENKIIDLENKFPIWKRLFTGTVPVNKAYLTGTVPVNKAYLTGTVPVNKVYLTGTVPVNKAYLTGTLFLSYIAKHLKKDENTCLVVELQSWTFWLHVSVGKSEVSSIRTKVHGYLLFYLACLSQEATYIGISLA